MRHKVAVVAVGLVVGAVIGGTFVASVADKSDTAAQPTGDFAASTARLAEIIEAATGAHKDRSKVRNTLAKIATEDSADRAGNDFDFDLRDPSRGIEPPTAHEPD